MPQPTEIREEGTWDIDLQVHSENPGSTGEEENESGIVVYARFTNKKGEKFLHEVSRVAFIRRASKNPETSFEDQLEHEKEKLRVSIDFLNSAQDRLLV